MPKSSPKPRIRAILSDWVKVVVDDGDNRPTSLRLARHSPLDAETVHEIMFGELREVFAAHTRGQLSTDGYRKTMRRALRLTCTDAQFDQAFADVFLPFIPVMELWKNVRAQGIRMVAASNIEELRHAKLKEMGVHRLFDAHCLSYQIGIAKPDATFFAEALGMAGFPADQALFVDDRAENVEVAARLGIQGHVYDRSKHQALLQFLDGYGLKTEEPHPRHR